MHPGLLDTIIRSKILFPYLLYLDESDGLVCYFSDVFRLVSKIDLGRVNTRLGVDGKVGRTEGR